MLRQVRSKDRHWCSRSHSITTDNINAAPPLLEHSRYQSPPRISRKPLTTTSIPQPLISTSSFSHRSIPMAPSLDPSACISPSSTYTPSHPQASSEAKLAKSPNRAHDPTRPDLPSGTSHRSLLLRTKHLLPKYHSHRTAPYRSREENSKKQKRGALTWPCLADPRPLCPSDRRCPVRVWLCGTWMYRGWPRAQRFADGACTVVDMGRERGGLMGSYGGERCVLPGEYVYALR